MNKWIYQKNNFSCVPIGLLNVMRWAGHNVSYNKDYKRWCKKLKCRAGWGTDWVDYHKFLPKISKIKIIDKDHLTISQIDASLKEGKVVLLRSFIEDVGHLSLIVARTNKSFFVVGDPHGYMLKNNRWVRKKVFKKRFLKKNSSVAKYVTYPSGWIVEKA